MISNNLGKLQFFSCEDFPGNLLCYFVTDKTNYRPVSCLETASKVLEKVVCEQITDYMETNELIPVNQHGFRKGRSTMSALADIQQEWTKNTDEKFITGIL